MRNPDNKKVWNISNYKQGMKSTLFFNQDGQWVPQSEGIDFKSDSGSGCNSSSVHNLYILSLVQILIDGVFYYNAQRFF